MILNAIKGLGVYHPLYGKGIILKQRFRGYEYYVRFNKFRLWVKGSELVLDKSTGFSIVKTEEETSQSAPVIEAIKEKLKPLKIQTPQTKISPDKIDDLKIIESFRLGIVPSNAISEWTEGRGAEMAEIQRWLESETEGALVMEGEYGCGKTHMLLFLSNDALKKNYAVSHSNFDPSEATAAFPKKVYRRIISNFKCPFDGKILDFRSFLHYAVSIAKDNPLKDHFLFSKVFNELKLQDLDETVWNWLEGREGIKREFSTLYDYTTVANIYCNIISALSYITTKVFGLRGFLILLDEAETAKSMYYSYQVSRGLNFFRGLALVANDDVELLDENVIKGKNCYVGKKSNLVYSGHLKIPYIYQIPTFLKVVFAITPGSLTSEFKKWRESISFLFLDNLLIEDMRKLFYKFVLLYKKIYGIEVKRDKLDFYFRYLLEKADYHSTRKFIKSMVELLDFMRFYPEENVELAILS